MTDIYNLSDPEFIGNIPVRTEIEVLSADKPKTLGQRDALTISCRGRMCKRSRFLGWTVRETIGVAVINTRALSKLKMSVTKE